MLLIELKPLRLSVRPSPASLQGTLVRLDASPLQHLLQLFGRSWNEPSLVRVLYSHLN